MPMYGTVGGGYGNYALNTGATVAGGITNFASGNFAAIPGGHENTAAGDYSLAMGRRAKIAATHDGAFVWADSTGAEFPSAAANEFAARATGGVRLNVDAAGGGIRIEPHATSPNVIGGYSGNSVAAGVYGATIGGGGAATFQNRVTDNHGTVSGGYNNRAGDNFGTTSNRPYATVGGGANNQAQFDFSTVAGGDSNTAGSSYATAGGGYNNKANGSYSTIGGGRSNTTVGSSSVIGGGSDNSISPAVAWVTIGGGCFNTASADRATVGGGQSNTASGQWSTVPGGYLNTAQGKYSLAAGRKAKSNHQGAFVWADSTNADAASSGADTFTVRAAGGIFLYSDAGMTAGVSLNAGDTSWSVLSDRNRKKAFRAVDGEAILREIAGLEVSTWNYVWETEDSVRHMGPMAQDFHAAFGLGRDEKVITTQEADGVAFAAIKALENRTASLTKENAELKARIEALEGQLKSRTAPPE